MERMEAELVPAWMGRMARSTIPTKMATTTAKSATKRRTANNWRTAALSTGRTTDNDKHNGKPNEHGTRNTKFR